MYCNRSYGCRLQTDLHVKGYRALVLENEFLEIVILPEKGGDILSLNYKPRGIDVLWRSPYGLSGKEDTYTEKCGFPDNYEGGWQEIFPSGSSACNYKGAQLDFHGEVKSRVWNVSVLEDCADRVSVKMEVICKKVPARLERVITLRAGKRTMELQESIENLSGEGFHYMWGHHPAFGAPFISEHARFELPAGRAYITECIIDGAACEPGWFEWPNIPQGRDISRGEKQGSKTKYMVMMDRMEEARCSIYNDELKMGVRMDWDGETMPHAWVWMSYNAEDGYPWYGRAYVAAVEPFSSILTYSYEGVKAAIENGTAAYLDGHETRDFHMSLHFYEDAEAERNEQ